MADENYVISTGGFCAPWLGDLPPVPEVTFTPRAVWGLYEVASVLGIKRKKLRRWIAKGYTPSPSAWLAMGPVWLAEAMEPWLRERLTVHPVRDSLSRFTMQSGGISYRVPPPIPTERG